MWFDLFSISYFYWLAVSSLSPEVSGTLGGAEEVSEPSTALNAEKGKKWMHTANSGTGGQFKGDICTRPRDKNRGDTLSALWMRGHLQEWPKGWSWASISLRVMPARGQLLLACREAALAVWSYSLCSEHIKMPLSTAASGCRGNRLWEPVCALVREWRWRRPRWEVKI